MMRLGFDRAKLIPRRKHSNFDKLRKSFCARLELLHTMIARQWRHNIFCWDYRKQSACDCGVLLSAHHERAFVLLDFTWSEGYLHHVRTHKLVVPKRFYLAVLKATRKRMPYSRLETETVNKLMVINE